MGPLTCLRGIPMVYHAGSIKAHHIKMQFSSLQFGHGLYDPHVVTFQGQTLFGRVCSLRPLISKFFLYEGP